MTTPLPELLSAVPALNDPKELFSYAVDGDSIVGTWNIVNAKYLSWNKAGKIDENYRITVKFDEKKKAFDFNEKKSSSESAVEVTDDGNLKLSFGKKAFSGKSTGKSFNFEFGGAYQDKGGDVKPYLSYSFETKRIKDPLFGFLKKNGWKRKEGLLKGLFNS